MDGVITAIIEYFTGIVTSMSGAITQALPIALPLIGIPMGIMFVVKIVKRLTAKA